MQRVTICGAMLVALAHLSAQPAPLIVGVLRQDGLLLPVARLAAGTWKPHWYPAEDGRTSPSIAAARASWFAAGRLHTPNWWLWPLNGQGPPATDAVPLTLVEPEEAESHCETFVMVRTKGAGEIAQQAVKPNTFPIRAVGLALSTRAVDVTTARTLDAATTRRLQPHAARAFREAEDRYVAAMPEYTRLELPPVAERLRQPVKWSHAYDLGEEPDGAHIFLLEGEFTYSEMTITAGQVWLRERRAQVTAAGEIELSGDYAKRGITRVPLGILRVDNHPYLVMQAYFYESEAVEIHEWPGTAAAPSMLVRVPAGGC